MYSNKKVRLIPAMFVFILVLLIAGAATLQAQTKQILAWQADLNYLEDLSDKDLQSQQAGIEQIRQGVALWIEMHPSTEIELPPAPDKPWNSTELRNQVYCIRLLLRSRLCECWSMMKSDL